MNLLGEKSLEIHEILTMLYNEKYPIIPSGGGEDGKRPLLGSWKRYQTKLPADATILYWNSQLKPQLWGCVTGQFSGIVVLDADDEVAMTLFREAGLLPHVRTPRGGAHYWFHHPGHPVATRSGILQKLDVRGDGGFCNFLGKNPATGGEYIIEILPTRDKLYPWDKMPVSILEAMQKSSMALRAPSTTASGATIPEGQRNCQLTSLAGIMRSAGMTEPEIMPALFKTNQDRCQPPLDDAEVQRIVTSICRYEPNDLEPFTDTGNAEFMVKLYKDELRYDHRHKKWLIWEKHHWIPDKNGRVSRLAITAARTRAALANNIDDEELKKKIVKWARESENRFRIEACIGMAQKIEPFADKGEGWDGNRMLLGAENGVIDLYTGQLRDGRPEDFITMSTYLNFDPDAKCPRWEQFIKEIFPDPELADWIRRVLGYSISGDATEHLVFMGYGSGGNGKTRFLNAVRAALGDYAQNTPFSTFALPKTTTTNDLAALENARFVISSETTEGTHLNEERIKTISGEDPVDARFLYKEFASFEPHLKLWLFVNHKPQITDDSVGIWRRMRLIPFTKQFIGQDADKQLGNKLRAEASGILAWLVQGCMEWQRRGLTPIPECVQAATQEYQRENDDLSRFIVDYCVVDPQREVKAGNLFKLYCLWARNEGIKDKDTLTLTSFGRRMTERYKKRKKPDGSYYQGIGTQNPMYDPTALEQ